jgi:two-component system response regulator MprA
MMATILIADDDPPLTALLRQTLAEEGYRVLTAADGTDALAQAQAHRPDLVVLDWLMPGLSGLEVARRLRALAGMPILMLTARAAIKDRVAGLDSGADDYLVKPFDLAELLARVRALLRRGPRRGDALALRRPGPRPHDARGAAR